MTLKTEPSHSVLLNETTVLQIESQSVPSDTINMPFVQDPNSALHSEQSTQVQSSQSQFEPLSCDTNISAGLERTNANLMTPVMSLNDAQVSQLSDPISNDLDTSITTEEVMEAALASAGLTAGHTREEDEDTETLSKLHKNSISVAHIQAWDYIYIYLYIFMDDIMQIRI